MKKNKYYLQKFNDTHFIFLLKIIIYTDNIKCIFNKRLHAIFLAMYPVLFVHYIIKYLF